MKKLIYSTLCIAVLLSLALPVMAEETQPAQQTTTAGTESTVHTCSFVMTGDTATCTAPGVKTYACSSPDCGETKTEESAAKGHSYGNPVSRGNAEHAIVCSVCSDTQTDIHSLDNGTVTKEATCQDAGSVVYTCSGCGYTETAEIPRLETHTYGKWEHDKTADSHFRVCSVCGYLETGKHQWDAGTVEQKPTCKDVGKKIYACSGCDIKLEETLSMLTTHTYDSSCDPQCNVCQREREVQHSFTKVWSRGYDGHWHECTKCGEKADFAEHNPGPEATEEQDQVCKTCSYVIAARKDHVHSYEKKWTSDAAGHWHTCKGKNCSVETDYAAHTFDNSCDAVCNVCDYKRDNAHQYDANWQTTAREHWQICTQCGEKSQKEKHVPGPEATEKTPQLCSVCDYELAAAREHTHDFGALWNQDRDTHWQECSCGESSVPEPHSWDEGRKNGKDMITYGCKICGQEKTEKAPAGFPWLTVFLSVLAAGCLAGIGVLVYMLKKGHFEEDGDDQQTDTEFWEETEQINTPEPDMDEDFGE